ncbi:hypothetical protein [Ignatzschineria indica]|nr:hypothetical protein [Ignatzschineria indica]
MITKKADELPEITSACFHELHAGKWVILITGKYYSIIRIFSRH